MSKDKDIVYWLWRIWGWIVQGVVGFLGGFIISFILTSAVLPMLGDLFTRIRYSESELCDAACSALPSILVGIGTLFFYRRNRIATLSAATGALLCGVLAFLSAFDDCC